MSHETSTEREARFTKWRMQRDNRAMNEMLDAQRMDFLRALDAAPFEVTDWEAQFIENFLNEPRGFTPDQRAAVGEMRRKYEHRLSPTVKLTDSSGEGKSRRSRLDSRDAATDTGHAPASPENSIDGQLQS